MPSPEPPPRWQVALALAVVYLVWGSTYLAVRVTVLEVPPLLTAALRFLAAGGLLYAALRLRGGPALPLRAWRAAAPVAVLMFLVAHGALAWALQRAPSGTAALFASLSPMWLLLAGAVGPAGVRPTRRVVAGLGLGFAGVLVMLQPWHLAGAGGLGLAAAGALLLSSVGWGLGSALSRRPGLGALSPLQTSAVAMLMGGTLLLAASAGAGELARFDAAAVPGRAWLALAYLVVVGSVLAFSAYVWLLRRDGAARASSHTFVNPVVAVALGAVLAGEPFTASTAAAVGLVLGAVVLLGRHAEAPHAPQVRLASPEARVRMRLAAWWRSAAKATAGR